MINSFFLWGFKIWLPFPHFLFELRDIILLLFHNYFSLLFARLRCLGFDPFYQDQSLSIFFGGSRLTDMQLCWLIKCWVTKLRKTLRPSSSAEFMYHGVGYQVKMNLQQLS